MVPDVSEYDCSTPRLLGLLLAMIAFGCVTARDELAVKASPVTTIVELAPAAAPREPVPWPESLRTEDGWSVLTPDAMPTGSVVVHDAVRGRAVLVSVDDGCWLWTWENDRWVRERRLADSISWRFLAYFDPRRRSVVIGSENEGEKKNWTFFAVNEPDKRWQARLPRIRLGESLAWAYDAARSRLIVVSGDATWAVSDGRVDRIGRLETSIAELAYDASTKRIIGVSSWADGHGRGGFELMVLGESGWKKLGEHPSWTGSRLGQDPATGRVIQFRADGRGDPKGGMVLFELHGDQWKRREPVWRSLLTSSSALVSNGDELLLHGGQDFRGGSVWTGRTWSCRAATCREPLEKFELPEPYRDASLVSNEGTTLYVNHETLSAWVLEPSGWRAWGPARAPEDIFLLPQDSLRPTGSEIPQPLFAAWGPSGLHLLAGDGSLWSATADRPLSPRAPAFEGLADDGQNAGHNALVEESKTGRLIAGVIRPVRVGQQAGAIWAFDQETWKRLDDVPGLAALASGPEGILALTSKLRLLRLAGSRWVELNDVDDAEADPGALMVSQHDGRVFARIGDMVSAMGPSGEQRLFSLPAACRSIESMHVTLDDKAGRWTVLCRDALYARPLVVPKNGTSMFP